MGDPLLTDHRLNEAERRLNAHSDSLREGQAAFVDLRQTVAVMGRDVTEIRRIAEEERAAREKAINEEREEREERDAKWERRVSRLTAAWFSLAGAILVGSVGTVLTFILTRGN